MILDMKNMWPWPNMPNIALCSYVILEAVQRLILANRSKRPSKELKCYSKALHELFKAVANHPDQWVCWDYSYKYRFSCLWWVFCLDQNTLLSLLRLGSDRSLHGSNEDLSGDSTAAPLQDSQVLFTETGVCERERYRSPVFVLSEVEELTTDHLHSKLKVADAEIISGLLLPRENPFEAWSLWYDCSFKMNYLTWSWIIK